MTAQLLYASAGPAPGRTSSGWGVLSRSGDFQPEVEEELVRGASVRLPRTLSDLPSRHDLDMRPVRFRYRPHATEPALGLWWRSAEAGADHTGRPGNVCTHAVAMRRDAPSRPADLWISPSWVQPYGPEEVRLAQVPSQFDLRGADFFAVKGWLATARDQLLDQVPWVIDALMAGVDRGQVLLRSTTVGESWGWVGLVSWLMPRSVASGMTFALGEDTDSAARCVHEGFHVVTSTDVQAVRRAAAAGGVPIVDTTVPPQLDGQTWVFADGRTVGRTAWGTVSSQLFWAGDAVLKGTFAVREQLADAVAPLTDTAAVRVWLACLRLGLLAAPGGQMLDRTSSIRSLITSGDLPESAWGLPVLAPLADEVGYTTANEEGTWRSPPARQSADGVLLPLRSTVASTSTTEVPEEPKRDSAGPTLIRLSAERGRATGDGTPIPDRAGGVVDVAIFKPADFGMSMDVLEEEPQPSVSSALRASAALAMTGTRNVFARGEGFPSPLDSVPVNLITALAHVMAMDFKNENTWEDLERIFEAAEERGQEKLVVPSLAVLMVRLDLTEGLPARDTLEQSPAYAAVRQMIQNATAARLDYLAKALMIAMASSAQFDTRAIWGRIEQANAYPVGFVPLWSLQTSDKYLVAHLIDKWLRHHGVQRTRDFMSRG